MATSKRKRPTTHQKANKRQKVPSRDSSQELYAAKAILQERDAEEGKDYLVDWEGIDPETGRDWSPTWIPAENANEELTANWNKSKAAAAKEKRFQQKKNRPVRVIESSPATASTRSSARLRDRSTPGQSTPSQYSASTSPLGPLATHLSPQVYIEPRSSFDPDEFERQSQLPASLSTISSTLRQLPNSSQHSYIGPRNYRSSGVVCDSEDEDEDGSASYIPTAHDVSNVSFETQHSSHTNEDNDLPPLLQEIGRVSPTITIPETDTEPENDPIEDSQIQHPSTLRPQSEDQRQVTHPLETIVSTSQPAPEPASSLQESTTRSTEHPIAQEHNESDSVEQARLPSTDSEQNLRSPIEIEDQQPLINHEPEVAASTEIELEAEEPPGVADQDREENLVVLESTTHTAQSSPQSITKAAEAEKQEQLVPSQVDPASFALGAPLPVLSTSPPNNTEQASVASPLRENRSASHNRGPPGAAERPCQASQDLPGPSIERRDFATSSNNNNNSGSAGLPIVNSAQPSPTRPSPSPQHAQIVNVESYSSTPEDLSYSIRLTIEKDDSIEQASRPHSRHDSSQESPEPTSRSMSSSSPPQPPKLLLDTLESNAPARPRTPADSSPSFSNMDPSIDRSHAQAVINKMFAKRQREHPPESKRGLLPSQILSESGTRSPSTIPDRPPQPQMPTSLRTVAIANSTVETATEVGPSEAPLAQDEGESGGSDSNVVPVAPMAPASSDEEELSDAEDDDASLLNDDLHLQPHEYIVPVPIEGRQASMIRDEIKNNKDILESYVEDPQGFQRIDKIEDILRRLRAIETHVDLIYTETQASQTMGPSTQIQHQTQWSYDNSIKFRFFGVLLDKLRAQDMHIILVINRDIERLAGIVETFLKGKFVNYKFPEIGRQADLTDVEGNVMVTVLSSDSSPIVRPPDLIVCLDGCMEAGQIRKENWAINPDRAIVPILHLVIPRTVDHIERYVSPNLNSKRRLHTVVATLGQLQLQGEIGRAILPHTPRTNEAADEIISFLASSDQDGQSADDWPLPSIGSIKDFIEFQSQQSQQSIVSPPPASVAAKRPLEDDLPDPAKRMRFTPQQQEQPNSSGNNEITHISDSMPGTAVEVSKLQEQLAHAQQAFEKEQALRKATEKRFREYQVSWDKQQTVHEDLSRKYNMLKSAKETAENKMERATNREASVRERLDTKATEHQDLQLRYKALQDAQLLSEDGKVAEIARLRKELAEAREAEQRAVKNKQDSEEQSDYMKEQYRHAQDVASLLTTHNEELSGRLLNAEKEAAGGAQALAQFHYERQNTLASQQDEYTAIQVRHLKQQLQAKEDEITRLKASRGVGVGTRAQSVGPRTPRPGSRAASPMPGNRDRLANLRNG